MVHYIIHSLEYKKPVYLPGWSRMEAWAFPVWREASTFSSLEKDERLNMEVLEG